LALTWMAFHKFPNAEWGVDSELLSAKQENGHNMEDAVLKKKLFCTL